MVNINWPGLLKWSTKHVHNVKCVHDAYQGLTFLNSPNADGTVDTNKRLSKEDIEFLQGAIKEALSQVEDPYEAINEAIRNFENKDDGIVLASAKIIERLIDEYPEVSKNLDKINAIDPLLNLLENPNNHILESVLQILSLALSNNPILQDSVFKKNGLKKLLIKLQESQKTIIDKKLITAISALIRHHDEAENKFIDYGGIAFLVYGMQTNIYKYQEKSALLLKHLIHQNKISFEIFEKNKIMKGLVCLANNKNIDETGIQYGETTAELFLALMQNHRHKLAKYGYLQNLKTLIEDRLVYLHVIQTSASYDVSHEIELFNDCLKLTSWPGVKLPEGKNETNFSLTDGVPFVLRILCTCKNARATWGKRKQKKSVTKKRAENGYAVESRVKDVESRAKSVESRVKAVKSRAKAVESRVKDVESRAKSVKSRVKDVEPSTR
ncbi:conserved Plasmodium protein, unknown function [Plasmodium ovale wallikeri]|uniref:Uncharacterized protein n=1 Tax=Plasmodium ovale wallikeri TaxID=864142 RepID=A0A1A8YK84_PLAOA|nr:conserved Plasmodium protein, unknown function [Plasmodium ovale wallikeri]